MIYHGMCGVHQTECTSPPIEVMLLDLSKIFIIRMVRIVLETKGAGIIQGLL